MLNLPLLFLSKTTISEPVSHHFENATRNFMQYLQKSYFDENDSVKRACAARVTRMP